MGRGMNRVKIDRAYKRLRVLTNASTWNILQALSENGPLSVKEVQFHLRHDSQSTVSLWLAELKEAKVVDCFADGRYRVYYLLEDELEKVANAVKLLNENAVKVCS